MVADCPYLMLAEIFVQLAGVLVFTKFSERLGFNLTNSFAGDGKFLTNFF